MKKEGNYKCFNNYKTMDASTIISALSRVGGGGGGGGSAEDV